MWWIGDEATGRIQRGGEGTVGLGVTGGGGIVRRGYDGNEQGAVPICLRWPIGSPGGKNNPGYVKVQV